MSDTSVSGILDGIDRDYWENSLQMPLEPWLKSMADRQYMGWWLGQLTKRQLRVLCCNLKVNGEGKLEHQRTALLSCDGRLTPYFLVDRFAFRRSRFAVADYSTTVLPKNTIESCRSGEQDFDTLALLFALYHADPEYLRTVYHLEKVHSTGFARMKLKGRVRAPDKTTFKEFLTREITEKVIAELDAGRDDGRTSELMNIVHNTDNPMVFIRRGDQRSMLIKSRTALHGFVPEWIIFDFRTNGKGVDISSHSMSVPLEIANRIASAYFGTKCEYENEVEVTYRAQIDKFVALLKHDKIAFLKLVEVHVKNSPLDGAPVLKIGSEADESVAEGVRHFEKAVAGILGDIDLVKSIKVLYAGKRVKLIFEPVAGVEHGYCVRYTDKSLNLGERRAFEEKVRAEPHGIRVLSTEKRHKQLRGRAPLAAAAK